MNKEDRKDLVERLRNVTEDDAYALPWTFGETCREAAAEIDRLRRELEEARRALEPFADIADRDIGEDEADSDIFTPLSKYNRVPRPTVGMFRRARAALRAREEGR